MRDRVRGWQAGARIFAEEVQQGRAERETELREQLGLRPHGTPELTASTTYTQTDMQTDTQKYT